MAPVRFHMEDRAELTGVGAAHWSSAVGGGATAATGACDDLLERKFAAFALGFAAVAATTVAAAACSQCATYVFTVRPILRALRDRTAARRSRGRLRRRLADG